MGESSTRLPHSNKPGQALSLSLPSSATPTPTPPQSTHRPEPPPSRLLVACLPRTQSPWWPRPNLSAILAVGTYPTYTALYLSFIKPNHDNTGCILPLSLNPHPVQTYLIVNRNLKHSPRFVVLLPQAPLGHRMMTPNTTTSHSMTSCSIYPSSRTGVHSI